MTKPTTPPRARAPRVTLGWREWVALPELGVAAVKAKVDTGARSSSLHAEDIRIVAGDGQDRVQFRLSRGPTLRAGGTQLIDAPLLDQRWITSSNGKRQKRPIIMTEISLSGSIWLIEISLSPRETMGFPMLLGREAIRGRFVVEPGRSFLAKDHIPKGEKRRPRKKDTP